MSWEAIATLAEVIGAVGVIATLLFVGFEIRRNSDATRAATIMQTLYQSAGFSEFIAQDRNLADLYFRGLKIPDDLEREEKSQFFWMLLSMFRRYENAAYQHRKKFLEDEAWESLRRNIEIVAERPGFEWFWERAKPGFQASFASIIDEMRANRLGESSK